MDISIWLQRCPIIAILRGIQPHEAEAVGAALEAASIAIVEVPLNSPDALTSIATLARVFGDRLLIGAGTVTDPEEVTAIAAAGGRLIVSPHADTAIVRAAKAQGLFAVPGFFNPTEAFALLQAGADAIKLFPAEVLGIPMLKALEAVLPRHAIVVPVGGIDAGNLAQWMQAGAHGVGLGSSIYRPGDTPADVRGKADALLQALRLSKSTPIAESGPCPKIDEL